MGMKPMIQGDVNKNLFLVETAFRGSKSKEPIADSAHFWSIYF
jgi:hypothetical protein